MFRNRSVLFVVLFVLTLSSVTFAQKNLGVDHSASVDAESKANELESHGVVRSELKIEPSEDIGAIEQNFLRHAQFSLKPTTVLPGPDEKIDDVKSSTDDDDQSFDWSSAVKQSLVFLGIQHGYAMTQPKTRRALKGPFIKDYFRSVKSLHGWEDGGRAFTNYIAHPLQGSFTGFIQVQNDPKGKGVRLGNTKEYWTSRAKALAWAAAWSTQFEIGPISQASIGNVGLSGKQTYVDIVMTPTAGIAMLITEDLVDRYVIKKIERYSQNLYLKALSRMLLNPTRTMANLLRLKTPWYRDKGLR